MMYTVVSGDTLSDIADNFGTTVAAIVQANGITNPNLIRVGQQLNVPVDSNSSAPVTIDSSDNTITPIVVTAQKIPVPASAPSGVFTFADLLKPPKLYFTLGALAIAGYFLSKQTPRLRRKRRKRRS